MRYGNHKLIKERGMDPKPKAGDHVAWKESLVHWIVAEGDLEGPQALETWPDGGWVNVDLIAREGKKVKGKP